MLNENKRLQSIIDVGPGWNSAQIQERDRIRVELDKESNDRRKNEMILIPYLSTFTFMANSFIPRDMSVAISSCLYWEFIIACPYSG